MIMRKNGEEKVYNKCSLFNKMDSDGGCDYEEKKWNPEPI